MEKWTIILSIFLVVQVADILAKKGDGGGYGDGTGDGDGYGDKYGSGDRPPKPYGPYCPMCKDVEGPGPLAGTYYFYDKEPQCENGCAYVREDEGVEDCCYCFAPGNYSVSECDDDDKPLRTSPGWDGPSDKPPRTSEAWDGPSQKTSPSPSENGTISVALLGGLYNGVVSDEVTVLGGPCPLPPLPAPVRLHSTAAFQDTIVSCGGVTPITDQLDGEKTTGECWKLSLDQTRQWVATANLPAALRSFGMTVVDSVLMVLGGNTEVGLEAPNSSNEAPPATENKPQKNYGEPEEEFSHGSKEPSIVPGNPLNENDIKHSKELDQNHDPMHQGPMTCGDHSDNDKRIAKYELASRWPNAVVPYTIEDDFTADDRALVFKAMNQISESSCVVFREKTSSDLDWMEIATKESTATNLGCNAVLGFTGPNSGASRLNLQKPGCMYTGTIVHEMFHILGFKHEHVRPDRDQYVTLRWSNILVGNAHNYWRSAWETEDTTAIPQCSSEGLVNPTNFGGCWGGSRVKDFGVAYDYKSIMHYGFTTTDTAFVVSTDVDVMTPLDSSALTLDPAVGSATEMSANDILRLKAAYSCDGCGGYKQANSGDLDGTKAATCEWIIKTVEANRGLTITIPTFTFVGDCSTDYVEIRYGNSKDGYLLGKFCKDNQPVTPITTRQNNLWIKSVKSKNSADTWTATWTSTELTCCSTVLLEDIGTWAPDMGLYTKVEGKTVGGRALYQQNDKTTPNYLYYAENYAWIVSTNYTTTAAGIRSKDATYCPEDALPWQSWNGDNWVDDTDAKSRCSDCTKYPDNPECAICCDTIAVEGLEKQTQFNGLYKKQDSSLNRRSIYKQDDQSLYLVYSDGGWKGKDEPTDGGGVYMKTETKAYCPGQMDQTWQAYSSGEYVNQANSKTRCSDCSKYPAEEECVECCTAITMVSENIDFINTNYGFKPNGIKTSAWTSIATKANGNIVYQNDLDNSVCLFTSPCGNWIISTCSAVSSQTSCGSWVSSVEGSKCPQTAKEWKFGSTLDPTMKANCGISCTTPPPAAPSGATSNWEKLGKTLFGGTTVTYTCPKGQLYYSTCSISTATWSPSVIQNCPADSTKAPVVTNAPIIPIVTEAPIIPIVTEAPIIPIVTEAPIIPIVTEAPIVPTVPVNTECSGSSKTWQLSSFAGLWVRGPDLSSARWSACTVTFDGLAVIIGGKDCSKTLATVEGVSKGEITPMPSLLVARHSQGCTVDNNMIVVAGGIGENGEPLASAEVYKNGKWMVGDSLPASRYNFPMLTIMDMNMNKNMVKVFPGAPDQNNVLVWVDGVWVIKMPFNFTLSQETAIDVAKLGIC